MICGECSLDNCSLEVIILTPEHVSQEYLDSLNDKQHLVHSRNIFASHTHESQIAYIKNFDFVHNFIFGVRCSRSRRNLATATFALDQKKQSINIGFMIFKNYSGRGYGHLILGTISDFCFEIFPGFMQEIGTRFENHAMRTIAQKVGFEYSRQTYDSEFVYYERLRLMQKNLKFLREPPALVITNDAGGSTHLAAILKTYNISAQASLSGPAIEIFNRFGVTYSNSSFPLLNVSSEYVLLGTSLYGGPESQALLDPALSNLRKIALLDHWVNYRERFHPSGKILPDVFLVTNGFAYVKAKNCFPDSEVLEIPDFQLAIMKLTFMKKVRTQQSAVILLEPESETVFGRRYLHKNLNSLLADAQQISEERNIQRIVIRPHPAHNPEYVRRLTELFLNSEFVSVSRNTDLIDDLVSADFVLGFHTYALYLAAELGIQTYSYFSQEVDHWTYNFPKIHSVKIN